MQIQKMSSPSVPLSVSNFKRVVGTLIQPHKEMISEVEASFKRKVQEYKNSNREKRSLLTDSPLLAPRRSPSNLSSDYSFDYKSPELIDPVKITHEDNRKPNYQFRQWKAEQPVGMKDYSSLVDHYQQVFTRKKAKKRGCNYYDFRLDEKEMLTRIFNEIKNEEQCVSLDNVVAFFRHCRLFYLYYNIRPHQLEDLLKESAHQYQDKLTLGEFLNVFFFDRPNITGFQEEDSRYVHKRCVLSEQNWKDLKAIFSTLDTFGNETITLQPFLFKVKNNYGNRQLINEPAIQYPEIGRTIPLKKIIFVLQHRCPLAQKVTWQHLEQLISDFRFERLPTIDSIYQKMIERAEITQNSNYFMLNPQIITEIKNIYERCPKYCQYFVKTKFICQELLEAPAIKKQLKEAVVRVEKRGLISTLVRLEDQIRLIANYAQNYIDLDQLLEYFSIKGPINTTAETWESSSEQESSDEENNERLKQLHKVRSQQKLKVQSPKEIKHVKPVRHLTVCEEFKLSTKQKESAMERKTKEWQLNKEKAEQEELNRKFKANPIPVQLNPQRYKSYVKRLEELKEYKREMFLKKKQKQNKIYQYLKSNTCLFDRKPKPMEQPQQQYTFSPKSIPWFVSQVYMLDNINQKKKLRRKHLQTDHKLTIIRQWKKLPDVMQDYDDVSNQEEDRKDEKDVNKPDEAVKGKKVKEVPDFKQLHQQFEEELAMKKKQFTPTRPQSFNFSSPKAKSSHNEVNQALKDSNHKKKLSKQKASIQTAIAKETDIPTTKKYVEMVNYTQQKLREKQIARQREQQEERDRKAKQANFARFMRKKLQQSVHSSSMHNLNNTKLSKHKYEWLLLQKQNEEDLCRMYSKVMARPFLFQSSTKPIQNNNSQYYAPMKKGRKQKWKQPKQEKHVHQSPLKAIQPEMNESSKFHKSPTNNFQPESSEDGGIAYMNQSF